MAFTELLHLLTYPMEQSPSWEATVVQLVKKFPTRYGTRRFITAIPSARHLSLSWVSLIQSIPQILTSWRELLILSYLCLGLPNGLFPSGFTTKILYVPFSLPIHVTCPAQLIFLECFTWTIMGEDYILWKSSCSFLHSSVTSSLLDPTPYSQTPTAKFLPQCERPSFTPIENNRQSYSSVFLNLYVLE